MNKKKLVEVMVGNGLFTTKKQGEEIVNAIFEEVTNVLTLGDTVELFGFGKFELVDRAAREGRNPKTGETMVIEASKAVKFKSAKSLKDRVNN